jgi:hypothetical protein
VQPHSDQLAEARPVRVHGRRLSAAKTPAHFRQARKRRAQDSRRLGRVLAEALVSVQVLGRRVLSVLLQSDFEGGPVQIAVHGQG